MFSKLSSYKVVTLRSGSRWSSTLRTSALLRGSFHEGSASKLKRRSNVCIACAIVRTERRTILPPWSMEPGLSPAASNTPGQSSADAQSLASVPRCPTQARPWQHSDADRKGGGRNLSKVSDAVRPGKCEPQSACLRSAGQLQAFSCVAERLKVGLRNAVIVCQQ